MTSSTFVSASGDGYDATMGRWSRRLAPLLIDFADIRGAGRVIDVGCGTGSLSSALTADGTVGEVVGVDLSPAYIATAKQQVASGKARFEIGDACALSCADASFDHAFSSLVLQFIPNPDLAVSEMRRVTRAGGTVAAATWDTRGGFVAWRMIFDTASVIDPAANERRARSCARQMVRPDGLTAAWSKAGLTDVTVTQLTIRMDFTSFDDFWLPHQGKDGPIADYLRTLEADKKEKLGELVRAAYLDGEPDGPRSYAATAWAVKGKVP